MYAAVTNRRQKSSGYLRRDEVCLAQVRVIGLLLCLLPEHAESRQRLLPLHPKTKRSNTERLNVCALETGKVTFACAINQAPVCREKLMYLLLMFANSSPTDATMVVQHTRSTKSNKKKACTQIRSPCHQIRSVPFRYYTTR